MEKRGFFLLAFQMGRDFLHLPCIFVDEARTRLLWASISLWDFEK